MAAKAVAFTEALRPEFATYAHQIVDNARALAEAFVREGLNVLTGGTDNHLLVLDVASTHGITGRQAEDAVRRCGITLNRNPIPFDPNGPWYTSGLRFGTAAVTTLGMGKAEMDEIASVVALVLKNVKPGNDQIGCTRQDEVHPRRDRPRPGSCPRQEPARLVSGLSRDRSAVSSRSGHRSAVYNHRPGGARVANGWLDDSDFPYFAWPSDSAGISPHPSFPSFPSVRGMFAPGMISLEIPSTSLTS